MAKVVDHFTLKVWTDAFDFINEGHVRYIEEVGDINESKVGGWTVGLKDGRCITLPSTVCLEIIPINEEENKDESKES